MKRLDVCSICLEKEGVDVSLLCCGAEFHLHCLTRWTSYSTNSKSCPLCRQENSGSWPGNMSEAGGAGGWFSLLYIIAKVFELAFGSVSESNHTAQRLTSIMHTPSTRGVFWRVLCSFAKGNYFKVYCFFFLTVYFISLGLLASVIHAHSTQKLLLNWNTLIVASLYTLFIAFLCDFIAAINSSYFENAVAAAEGPNTVIAAAAATAAAPIAAAAPPTTTPVPASPEAFGSLAGCIRRR